jgi:hypothetical protein
MQMVNEHIRAALPAFVRYVDIWPLTRTHPFEMTVHLPEPVIRAEWDMLAKAIGCRADSPHRQ